MFLAHLVDSLLRFYGYLLIARIIISWFRINRYNPWIRLLIKLTDPFLEPFRRLVPPLAGIDFSPVLAFFVLHMLRRLMLPLFLGF